MSARQHALLLPPVVVRALLQLSAVGEVGRVCAGSLLGGTAQGAGQGSFTRSRPQVAQVAGQGPRGAVDGARWRRCTKGKIAWLISFAGLRSCTEESGVIVSI